MRPLGKNEQTLLIILAVSLFFLGNLIGLNFLLSKKKVLQANLVKLKTQQRNITNLLNEKDVWFKRKEWLEKHQPQFQDSTKALSDIQEIVKKSANSSKVTLEGLESSYPIPNSKSPHTITLPLKVTGSLEALIRFLNNLQQPENFLTVSSITLKASETEPSKSSKKTSKGVVCENLKVTRYYQP